VLLVEQFDLALGRAYDGLFISSSIVEALRFMSRRRPVLAAAVAAVMLNAGPAAQQDKRKPNEAQAREIQTAVKTIDDVAAGQAAANELALAWQHEDYLKALKRTQYVPFTVSIDRSNVSSGALSFYWRVVEKGSGGASGAAAGKQTAGNKKGVAYEDFTTVPVTAQNPMRISRSFTVPAGVYDVYVFVKETASADRNAPAPKVAVLQKEVTVPDFWNGDLNTSTVILAERIDPLPAPLSPQQRADRPYALGTMEIIPAASTAFSKSSELSTFLLIYNPRTDAANKPDILVEYNFYAKTAGAPEKFFNKTPPTSLNAQTLPPQFDVTAGYELQTGQAVPLATFPEGEYRLEIKITDKIANTSLTREVNFSVSQS
jgi:hypothetical protein